MYKFTAIDTCTRIGYARIYKSKSSSNAKDFIHRLGEYMPFEIKEVHTDNGSEFLEKFQKKLDKLGIEQFWTDIRSPEQNGRVGRFIQSMVYELWAFENIDQEIDRLNEILERWLYVYNHLRPHQALGYKSPMESFRVYNKS